MADDPAAAAPAAAASGGGLSWWGSLLQEVQGGLSEFVTVVSQDTRAQAQKVERTLEDLQERSLPPNQLASELVGSVARGIGRFLADDSPDASRAAQSASPARSEVHSDRYRSELEAIRRNPATFTDEPGPADEWAAFQAAFRLSEQSQEISRLLAHHPQLRAVHARLVPATVPQDTFWLRYFFVVHRLDEDDQRRRTLFDAGRRKLADDEEPIRWDEDDDDDEEASEAGALVAPSTPASAPSSTLAKPATPQPPLPRLESPQPRRADAAVLPPSAPTGSKASTPSPPSLISSRGTHSQQPSSEDGFELVRPAAAAAVAPKPAAVAPRSPAAATADVRVGGKGHPGGDKADDEDDDDLLRELDDLPDAPAVGAGGARQPVDDGDLGEWE